MEQKREQALRKAREDAKHIVDQARRESESVIAELKKMKKNAASGDASVNDLRRRLDKESDALAEGLGRGETDGGEAPKTVKAGDQVKILTLGVEGTVLAPPDEKGEVRLQAGMMKFTAELSQLRLIRQAPAKEKKKKKKKTGMMTRTVKSECDVRGMNLEEALDAVSLYLDEAVLAGLNEVYVIHGKGTGILRAGIQQDLRKNKHVKSFRRGMYGEGEDGVTVVTLK